MDTPAVKRREPQRHPKPLRLCEPDHTVPACPGLHFHLLVTDLDSEGGSSWETAIRPLIGLIDRLNDAGAEDELRVISKQLTRLSFRVQPLSSDK